MKIITSDAMRSTLELHLTAWEIDEIMQAWETRGMKLLAIMDATKWNWPDAAALAAWVLDCARVVARAGEA